MSTSVASGTDRNLIVVVEDDEAVRDSLQFSFVIEGFAVRAFSSGQQLLAETSLPAGDCFVVDQNMPGMCGLDLISTLRARDLTAPAILITSHPSAAVRDRAAAAGVSIVEKPFLDFTLLNSVRRSLAQPSAQHINHS
jgi:two-component system, LuxR family, response regulator FixJ